MLDLLQRSEGEWYVDNYESEAILLGLTLKKELNNASLSIINDNQHAVSRINGITSFDTIFFQESLDWREEKEPEVFWSPRAFVKQADRLSVYEATRIFAPDTDFDDYFT